MLTLFGVTVVLYFMKILSGPRKNSNMAAIYSNGGNRWNILGFNFTKRDALSSVNKISMVIPRHK
jgi:hypothetical protein